jgi:hypothetical protein
VIICVGTNCGASYTLSWSFWRPGSVRQIVPIHVFKTPDAPASQLLGGGRGAADIYVVYDYVEYYNRYDLYVYVNGTRVASCYRQVEVSKELRSWTEYKEPNATGVYLFRLVAEHPDGTKKVLDGNLVLYEHNDGNFGFRFILNPIEDPTPPRDILQAERLRRAPLQDAFNILAGGRLRQRRTAHRHKAPAARPAAERHKDVHLWLQLIHRFFLPLPLMQILEELGTFIISVALALAVLGVAAVLLYYFNPQQPPDHAKAAFYPLVKPLNATHVWLGVKPSADRVEVVELKYQYRGRWVDVPVARLTADRAVWLNTTDGRPAAVPCSANVTVATRYGTASRAVSFTPVCLQKQPQIRDDLTVLVEQMVSYGSYVLDYVAYKSTPVLTAYFGFGSMHIGFQNVGPFPYMAVRGAPTGGGLWPPSVYAVSLAPGEHKNIGDIPSGEPWFPTPNGTCRLLADLRRGCGVMYRWMNIYVYWNDTLEIWINNVRVYNGTPPAAAAEYTAPQGFTVAFDPGAGTLEIRTPHRIQPYRVGVLVPAGRSARR